MQLLRTSSISTKKQLVAFYADQMAHKEILTAIQQIQKITKTNYKGKDVKNAHLLSVRDVIIFIFHHDAPSNCTLDEEMQKRLDDYRRVYGFKKQQDEID